MKSSKKMSGDVYYPSKEVLQQANITEYEKTYRKSIEKYFEKLSER